MEGFDRLDFASKENAVSKFASLIFAMPYYHYMIRLYSWDRYFIEVYFDTEVKKVTRIARATDSDMEKYLSKIKLDSSAFSA
jgi:hypothetical protein